MTMRCTVEKRRDEYTGPEGAAVKCSGFRWRAHDDFHA